MPWSGTAGSETFGRTDGTSSGATTWQSAAAAPRNIEADDHDTHDQDVANGINACLKKDGGNTATANIPMGGFKLTNIASASDRGDSTRYSDLQDNKGEYIATVGGTADAITLTPTVALPSYTAGQRFTFIAGSTNTTAVTVALSALAAKSIVRPDGSHTALSAGDIVANAVVDIEYDGTRFQLMSWRSQADISLDTTPQLGGNLDANGKNILFDTSTGLYDDAGNEQLIFTTTASAINCFRMTNAGTGVAVTLEAAGDDTNIDAVIAGKGTGGVIAAFKGGGSVGLRVLDSNSSHYLGILTSSNLTANRNLDIVTGDASRTLTLGGDLSVGGAVVFSGAATVPSGFAAAAASDQETATSTVAFVAPGTQHRHPSAAKAWVRFNAAGTVAASYNITSVTDTGTGDWTVVIGTDFSSTSYCGVVSGGAQSAGPNGLVYTVRGTPAAGTFQINAWTMDTGVLSALADPTDPAAIFAAFFGDQ